MKIFQPFPPRARSTPELALETRFYECSRPGNIKCENGDIGWVPREFRVGDYIPDQAVTGVTKVVATREYWYNRALSAA